MICIGIYGTEIAYFIKKVTFIFRPPVSCDQNRWNQRVVVVKRVFPLQVAGVGTGFTTENSKSETPKGRQHF